MDLREESACVYVGFFHGIPLFSTMRVGSLTKSLEQVKLGIC